MENNNFFELIHNAELFNDATMTLFMKKFNLNVNISQILALSKLKEEGPQKPSTLALALGYTSGAITKLTNNLVKEGYILREHQKNDRRVVLITITKKGLKVLEEAQKQGQNMRNEVYSVLNIEEVEQLLSIQKKLFERVKYLNTESR
ncbi:MULTISPECIES: MarR family winged helix-turn-helix transcriptional regulator [Staphylococcus]|mgnify:CR=1 FL=1|jgi:DNA-binding MarR family transcriptional regulator|uniref:Transcriptional regulator n=1 Tax=Staphylococcus nepalensis TaxID=214473 RepID=A0A291JND2_9STAP|nr:MULTISPECIES: MarR family transcriptional regulator [Staphylococcus]VDG68286.1 transcriptional regulator [Lacrimispora indolis]ATH61242.1 MarR family transcriptional regulator [Staphylococcus nepalensis]ATH66273.1 MarR family transcriptional regulator [Staphylococcus nepalensis]AWI45660.1 MarR family transcriptional regulator [Staphylococcus nepalensis]MBO1206046.1 MarR family transcriptional regulator [Staphylococcus nepalensis]